MKHGPTERVSCIHDPLPNVATRVVNRYPNVPTRSPHDFSEQLWKVFPKRKDEWPPLLQDSKWFADQNVEYPLRLDWKVSDRPSLRLSQS